MVRAPALGDDPLPRSPKHRVPHGRGKKRFGTSVALPADVARAIRRVTRKQQRSMSDLISEACRYYLDVTHPDWEDWEREADADGR